MAWWGRAKCPVRQVEQEWIESSLDWLLAEFGSVRLRGTVVLPTFQFSQDESYYRTSRLGYLTEPMFGYALARYAWLRDEMDPPWARYLTTNPRAFLNRGLRFLARNNS